MKTRSINNYIILVIFTCYILAYKFFIFENFMKYSEIITASFSMALLAISIKLLGFRKDKTKMLQKNVLKVVIFYLFLAFFVQYGLGIVFGFLKNAYSRALFSLFDNAFAPIITILSIELVRYVVIWANKDKRVILFLITLIITMLEIATSTRSIDFTNASAVFSLISTIILPAITKNIVLSYICYHIGYRIPIIYRIVMDTYVFFVPILPNTGEYITSMVLISLPILIYISTFNMIDERSNKPEPIFKKGYFTITDIPITILLVIMIALISGLFPHFMIGIGSNSMSPKINKGDAVIIKKYNSKKQTIKNGDIIAYNRGKVVIVHRVVNIEKKNGIKIYTTKGDANGSNDANPVSEKQIKGTVSLKIPFIAYPTVWLSELINNR